MSARAKSPSPPPSYKRLFPLHLCEKSEEYDPCTKDTNSTFRLPPPYLHAFPCNKCEAMQAKLALRKRTLEKLQAAAKPKKREFRRVRKMVVAVRCVARYVFACLVLDRGRPMGIDSLAVAP